MRRQDSGFTVNAVGQEERVTVGLGAAISVAQNIAVRIQSAMGQGDEMVSVYVRELGGVLRARVDVHHHLIETWPV